MLQPRAQRWWRRLASYVVVLTSRSRSRRRDTAARAAQGWSFVVRDQHRYAWTLRTQGSQLLRASAAAELSGDRRGARRHRRFGDRALARAAVWDAKARAESQRLVRGVEQRGVEQRGVEQRGVEQRGVEQRGVEQRGVAS